MPELPEVETTCRGIAPLLVGKTISSLTVRDRRLRWPVSPGIERKVRNQMIVTVKRRGKYIVIELEKGALLIHLGMSGRLRILPFMVKPGKHDHIDMELESGQILRYTDARRFGAFMWMGCDPALHPLLAKLGPEPLADSFTGEFLHKAALGRKTSIKSFVMDSHVVVGVGNIYANEALFQAGILPSRVAGELSLAECRRLVREIRRVLNKAIRAGGTTLRDFSSAEGKPGYFRQELQVYGRAGEPCNRCRGRLVETRQGQRTTVFCPACQV